MDVNNEKKKTLGHKEKTSFEFLNTQFEYDY